MESGCDDDNDISFLSVTRIDQGEIDSSLQATNANTKSEDDDDASYQPSENMDDDDDHDDELVADDQDDYDTQEDGNEVIDGREDATDSDAINNTMEEEEEIQAIDQRQYAPLEGETIAQAGERLVPPLSIWNNHKELKETLTYYGLACGFQITSDGWSFRCNKFGSKVSASIDATCVSEQD